jgi:hypothetical protein
MLLGCAGGGLVATRDAVHDLAEGGLGVPGVSIPGRPARDISR